MPTKLTHAPAGGNASVLPDRKLRRALALLVLAALGSVEAIAFTGQIWSGFRPFGGPPGRIPFSWDMFAVRIERCDVQWTPPLPVGAGLARFHDVAAPFEWDPVYDRREDYRHEAMSACALARVSTVVTLRCFTPEGERDDAFPCP